MPVKKKPKKKPAKKTDRKKTTANKIKKSNQKEIKKAVEKLPGLIVEKIKIQEKIAEENLNSRPAPTIMEIKELKPVGEIKTRVGENFDDGRDKKWLMWLGVIIFITIIFGLWGWNLYVKFQDSAKIKELIPIKNIQTDWENILDENGISNSEETTTPILETPTTTTEAVGETIDLKEKIKQNLNNLINAINTSSTTTIPNNQDTITPSL